MQKTRIKICDVNTPQTAAYCAECGVDYIGLHLISKPAVQERLALFGSIKEASGRMPVVLVTKIKDINLLADIIDQVGFDLVQLHFKTTACFIQELKRQVRVRTSRDVGVIAVISMEEYRADVISQVGDAADFLLFDTSARGGTGRLFPEEYLEQIRRDCGNYSYFIAGGLTADNVMRRIKIGNPFGVDVQSGVACDENHHMKDHEKIKLFVETVTGLSRLIS